MVKQKRTRAEILEKKRQAERARYQRIKNDPVKHAEQQKREKLKYLRKKEQGKVKAAKDMTPRELRQARNRWRRNIAAFRERKQNLKDITNNFIRENTPDSVVGEQRTDEKQEALKDGRKLAARKRSIKVRKNHRKCMKDSDIVIMKLKKQLYKYKKRLQRVKKNINAKTNKLTPNSKVDQILADSSSNAKEKVRKHLLFGEVLKQQLSENFSNLRFSKEKHVFTKVVTGDLVNKYKIHKEMKNVTKKMMMKAAKSKSLLEYNRKQRTQKINNTVQTIIRQFLEDDDNSRLCAGKKEYRTKNKEKKQKRILNDTMKNLHKKFLSFNKITISYSIFCKLRPFWIVQPKTNNRDTCLCITHANFDLLLQSLNQVNIIAINNYQKFLKSICCSQYNEVCLARKCAQCATKHLQYQEFNNSIPILLYQWETITEEIANSETKNCRKIRKYAKISSKHIPRNIIIQLEDRIPKFLSHQFNIVHQYNELKLLKNNISERDCIIHMDFSENYNTKYSQEIQAFHFGASRTQISLHTVIIYTRNPNDNSISTTCVCTLASNLAHGPAAIWAHLKPLSKLLPERVVNIHFLSDGPVTQYRNKTMFFILACKLHQFFPQTEKFDWNFYEAGHGKGAPDGIGAVCKRTADKWVALGKDVSSLETLLNIIKENCPEIQVFVIHNKDIHEVTSLINANVEKIISFKGTLQVHQVCGNIYLPNKIVMKSLSCFCNKNGCDHYKIGVLQYSQIKSKTLTVDDVYSASEIDSENESRDFQNIANPTTSGLSSTKNLYLPGNFLLVELSCGKNKTYRYAAICSGEVDEEEEIKVTFLKLCDDNGLIFRVDDGDISYVTLKQILYCLPMPELFLKGDRYFYKFPTAVDVFEK